MPWKEVNKMSLRSEFVLLASNEDANFCQLCKRFGISRTLGYRLLKRYEEYGTKGLFDRSKKPHHSPAKTSDELEQKVLEVRDKHYSWGGRKIYHYLKNNGLTEVPHPNTITDILRRHGRLYEWCSEEPKKFNCRYVRAKPNDLWQMDFKGHFPLFAERCHPLTILDDHSRYAVALEACTNETKQTVQGHLINVFRRYGLPLQINTDNGSPWGTSGSGAYSALAIWLMRLGVHVSYSRPGHPQTNGKDERFHRSLKQEVINRYTMRTIPESQKYFDRWRKIYNNERPHEAIDYDTPVKRYQASNRIYPESLAAIEYLDGDIVRKVGRMNGCILFQKMQIYVGYAFRGEPVAIRAAETDGVYNIFYCQQKVKTINLLVNEHQQ